MASRRRVATTALLLLAAAVAAATGAAKVKPAFRVTSTLDGKTVVPYRMRWIATVRLPASRVKEVDFLIDGGKRWVQNKPPYTAFGDEDDGSHKGWLVTSWLTPGKHRFTARAITYDGRRADDTVVARVLPSPELPTGLAGTWQRTIADTSAAPAAGSPANPTDTYTPAGTYTMVISRQWIQVRFPGTFSSPESDDTGEGWIIDNDFSAGPSSLRAFGGMTRQEYSGQPEGGWWCYADGPPADYTWSVAGDTLTLAARGADGCGVRGFVWSGQWARVG